MWPGTRTSPYAVLHTVLRSSRSVVSLTGRVPGSASLQVHGALCGVPADHHSLRGLVTVTAHHHPPRVHTHPSGERLAVQERVPGGISAAAAVVLALPAPRARRAPPAPLARQTAPARLPLPASGRCPHTAAHSPGPACRTSAPGAETPPKPSRSASAVVCASVPYSTVIWRRSPTGRGWRGVAARGVVARGDVGCAGTGAAGDAAAGSGGGLAGGRSGAGSFVGGAVPGGVAWRSSTRATKR